MLYSATDAHNYSGPHCPEAREVEAWLEHWKLDREALMRDEEPAARQGSCVVVVVVAAVVAVVLAAAQ